MEEIDGDDKVYDFRTIKVNNFYILWKLVRVDSEWSSKSVLVVIYSALTLSLRK